MRIKRQGQSVRVRVSENEVREFMRNWPASGLRAVPVTFEFDSRGDLVDIVGNQDSSEALSALADDALRYAIEQGHYQLGRDFQSNPGAKMRHPIYSYASAQTAYHDAHRGRGRGKIGNNTFIETNVEGGGGYSIILHRTPIVTYHPDGSVTLRHGGHMTATTKARMNEVLPPGWSVSQKNFKWEVHTPKAGYNFLDGMRIQENGTMDADEVMRLTDPRTHRFASPGDVLDNPRFVKDRHDAMYPRYQMPEWEYDHLRDWLASGRAPISLRESEDASTVRIIASRIQAWMEKKPKEDGVHLIESGGWPRVFDAYVSETGHQP